MTAETLSLQAGAIAWDDQILARLKPGRTRLAPQLVGNYKKAEPVEQGGGFAPAFRAWTTRDRTRPGHIGSPQLATAEKGELLFQHFASGLVRLLERAVAWDGKSWSD